MNEDAEAQAFARLALVSSGARAGALRSLPSGLPWRALLPGPALIGEVPP